jgi:hypothetical protein
LRVLPTAPAWVTLDYPKEALIECD